MDCHFNNNFAYNSRTCKQTNLLSSYIQRPLSVFLDLHFWKIRICFQFWHLLVFIAKIMRPLPLTFVNSFLWCREATWKVTTTIPGTVIPGYPRMKVQVIFLSLLASLGSFLFLYFGLNPAAAAWNLKEQTLKRSMPFAIIVAKPVALQIAF
jgi:hypothetical protein